jgi:hypothetical protein
MLRERGIGAGDGMEVGDGVMRIVLNISLSLFCLVFQICTWKEDVPIK